MPSRVPLERDTCCDPDSGQILTTTDASSASVLVGAGGGKVRERSVSSSFFCLYLGT